MFAILALSLTFASCADSTDTDDENPSPALPANVGENPIKETVKLKKEEYSSRYLEIRTDGTAIYCEDIYEEGQTKFKYTYDTDVKEIYMKVEKAAYYNDWNNEEEWYQLLSYDEIRSKINKDFTTEKIRQVLKDSYEREKDDEYYKDNYANYNSYDDYENELVKEAGVGSFDDYVKRVKQEYENEYKATFGAQITYAYDTKDSKMTLTEKFTGVKNLLDSECEFRAETGYDHIDIDCYSAWRSIKEDDFYYYYYGTLDTSKKTIDFEKRKETKSDNGKYKYETIGHVNATYTEDIDRGTVTIDCEGKKYVCEFEGEEYTQVE